MSGSAGGAVALAGGNALVTGASSGIGAAAARALDGRGVRVALVGRDTAALAAIAADLSEPVVIEADLAAPGEAADTVVQAVAALGRLDIVVSNAGAGWAGPYQAMSPAELDGIIDINLRAGAHLVHAALPHLLAKGRGHIVMVGSIAGLLPVAGEAAYSASKAGLAALGEALRGELRGSGVKVSVVNPGVVDTNFFQRRNRPYDRDRPRPIPASQVADAIVDCLERGRPETVVPAWLALPVRLRGAVPNLYRLLSDRFA
ncbi:SDR family NAD(P)-dependent oxidoreductase [Acidiferrimicrobium sp. IK]|uniref:SDR family NAD(P)-dependent oxidoreductase n=1 Tax=Acidiferrimicrobium sp. IK TaxID=2871700 RepID=UPI0021CB3040|nr:SDR family NAD(P)-dependent oxidoreductase [Acidiferrimicrobium sp. IK]MCU4184527.1 SDR family NAD(P)-dependent oxidoreductase [Acidiferrimicrobium sp. IK]